MYFKEYIDLGFVTETEVDFEVVPTVTYKKVFANKLSVRRSEYYEAKKIGLRAEIGFAVRYHDYTGQTRLLWNDKTYYLIRSGEEQKNDTIELYFSSEVEAKHEYEPI